jgi:hypothetical protein
MKFCPEIEVSQGNQSDQEAAASHPPRPVAGPFVNFKIFQRDNLLERMLIPPSGWGLGLVREDAGIQSKASWSFGGEKRLM